MPMRHAALAASLALTLAACTATATGSVTPSASTKPAAGASPAPGAAASPATDATAVTATLTLNGQPVTTAPLAVNTRGLPGFMVTGFSISTGSVDASPAGASVGFGFTDRQGGVQPGFTEADGSATLDVRLQHPTHGQLVSYTTGRANMEQKALDLDGSGGRVKGTITLEGRPWGVGDFVGTEKDTVVFTFDIPFPTPPAK